MNKGQVLLLRNRALRMEALRRWRKRKSLGLVGFEERALMRRR
jgi:hypothetical protein